jgi:hypothetical protein
MKLSKTNFLIYRECAHNAWLKVHRPEVYNAVPLSEFDKQIIETGNEVDVLARSLFPGGRLLERGDAEGTKTLVTQKCPILYQPYFETDRYVTACDILVWNGTAAAYDLFEVKSSSSNDKSKARTELYAHDIAFQAEVVRANGVPLCGLHLVRLNSEYRRGDSLDVRALFTIEDYSQSAAEIREQVAVEMEQAFDVLASDVPLPAPCKCIEKGRSAHCSTFSHSNPEVPEYSIHDITRIGTSKTKLGELLKRGILRIEDVPEDFALSESQRNQVEVAKANRPMIDKAAIGDFLRHMSYPISFIDYETFPASVPRYAGYRPFDQIPFQFSLDIVAHEGAPVRHFEFLHTKAECPDGPFIAALKTALPPKGSIVVWNATFEGGINDLLAGRNPEVREFFAALEPRIVDLMDVFSLQAYVDPGFKGRTSIKAILPVLVPQLSYENLAIREGATAGARWNDIVTGAVTAKEAEDIRPELLAYCGLDSKAMVEIWRVLCGLIAPARKVG